MYLSKDVTGHFASTSPLYKAFLDLIAFFTRVYYLFDFTQCICPKTWQVAFLSTPISAYTVYLSNNVTGAFSLPALRVYLSKDVAGTPPSPILS